MYEIFLPQLTYMIVPSYFHLRWSKQNVRRIREHGVQCARFKRYCNPPINSKLQHPPRAYPGHLTVHRAQGGGNLNVALKGWGI